MTTRLGIGVQISNYTSSMASGGGSVTGPGDGFEVDGFVAVGLGVDARVDENWVLGAGTNFSKAFSTDARSLEGGVHVEYRWSATQCSVSMLSRRDRLMRHVPTTQIQVLRRCGRWLHSCYLWPNNRFMAKVRICGPGRPAPKTTRGCMPAKSSCRDESHDHQVLEPDSPLQEHANLDLSSLRQHLPSGPVTIYSYVIESVRRRDGTLVHDGSGPNIEGGLITLCTCKARLRTYPDVAPGTWLAGFAGSRQARDGRPKQRNTLFYLTRVHHTFDSQMSLWRSPLVPEKTKRRKSSRHNRLGDLFEPRDDADEPFVIESYHPPMPDHSHAGTRWHADIQYQTRDGRRPAVLVGDPRFSFVWTEPRLDRNEKLGRGTPKCRTMHEFLSKLRSK